MQPTVLKFGGTSVHDEGALERLAGIVRSQLADHPVVVVSAMRGVTDALLTGTKLAREGALDPVIGREQEINDLLQTGDVT